MWLDLPFLIFQQRQKSKLEKISILKSATKSILFK